jgi:hypothetical protein
VSENVPEPVAVQYVGPFDRVIVPAHGLEVDRGETVAVSPEAAEELLGDESSWVAGDVDDIVADDAAVTDTEGE